MPRRRAGFTLIEMMVVVSILLVLIAATTMAITSAGRSARFKKTTGLLTRLKGAIGQYQTKFGEYPPQRFPNSSDNEPVEGAKTLIYYLCIEQKIITKDPDGHKKATPAGPFLEASRDLFEDSALRAMSIDSDEAFRAWRAGLSTRTGPGDLPQLLDAFGQPIYYDLIRGDGFESAPGGKDPRGGEAKNPDAYDMWSVGADGKASVDDLTSWD